MLAWRLHGVGDPADGLGSGGVEEVAAARGPAGRLVRATGGGA